jgi:ribose transport system permease protein
MQNKKYNVFMRKNKDIVSVYILMSIIFIIFVMNQNDFFTPYGPQSIFNQIITLSIAALAQTLVVLTSGIDMSIGSIIGLTNAIAATIMASMISCFHNSFIGVVVTLLVTLGSGIITGLINGLAVVYGRIQPIIVTIATSSIFLGIALYIRPDPGGIVDPAYSEILTGNIFTYIPVSAIILFVFIFLIWIPFRRTRLCQAIYAIGGNEYSAYISGIDVNKTKIWTYILAGLFSACAGILLTAQTASGDPLGSSLFTIKSIAAVVLGGTALSGGKGGYIGSFAGAVILSLVLGLLIFWHISSFYQDIVQGGVLILALTISNWKNIWRKKTISPVKEGTL